MSHRAKFRASAPKTPKTPLKRLPVSGSFGPKRLTYRSESLNFEVYRERMRGARGPSTWELLVSSQLPLYSAIPT